MNLYIFNSDADMALADNTASYMAPAIIRRMAEDLALLPAWYAPAGSGVLAPSAYNADYLQQMQHIFSLPVQLVTEAELSGLADIKVFPWGWSKSLRMRLLKGGVPEEALPASIWIDEHKVMVSRAYTISLQRLFSKFPPGILCGCSRIVPLKEREELPAIVSQSYPDGCVFKTLWSGSGRGLYWCRNSFSQEAANWCNRALQKDGAVMMEPIYNKVYDFAMEFCSDGQGEVRFVGYSRFRTNEKGAYQDNRLASDEEIEAWIGQYIPLPVLSEVCECLRETLASTHGKHYAGYLGVDMMICRDGASYLLHPSVEVNFRMNMGVVSHILYERFLAQGCEGRLVVEGYQTNEALRTRHEEDVQRFPLVVEEGRMVSGYLSLTPVTRQSRYRAAVLVSRNSCSRSRNGLQL